LLTTQVHVVPLLCLIPFDPVDCELKIGTMLKIHLI
jgi:hypothetical protein